MKVHILPRITMFSISIVRSSEVGIYKRKQESKKKKDRKHAFDQESNQKQKKRNEDGREFGDGPGISNNPVRHFCLC